jgi:hypothetical protein
MKMKYIEVMECLDAENYWGSPCVCCDGTEGVDELRRYVCVCERCLEHPEQIDAKLERQAVDLEQQAAWLRNLKGRIKASSAKWIAAKRKAANATRERPPEPRLSFTFNTDERPEPEANAA